MGLEVDSNTSGKAAHVQVWSESSSMLQPRLKPRTTPEYQRPSVVDVNSIYTKYWSQRMSLRLTYPRKLIWSLEQLEA
jgi:hypothetical protein